MSTDRFVLVISVAVAVRRAHGASLIERWLAEGLVAHGGNSNTLLLRCEQCRRDFATSLGSAIRIGLQMERP